MPSLSALELFAVAAFALIIVPGPSVLYIVSQSVGHGRVGGLAAVLGTEVGAFVHITGAALGLSAIIASSATAFSALKLAGGAYLIVLGIKRLREPDVRAEPGSERTRPLLQAFGWNPTEAVLHLGNERVVLKAQTLCEFDLRQTRALAHVL